MPLIKSWELASALLTCLCGFLEDSVGGPVCQCCLRPGIAPPVNDVCCDCTDGQGQAAVQVVEIFGSESFPRKGITQWKGPCTKTTMTRVAELVMTVYRCVGTPDEKGNPPSCERVTEDEVKILSDADAMWQAFACCDWAGTRRKVLPGSWQALPNLGGCGGGMMNVYVDLGPMCCPEPAPEVP